MDDRWYEHFFQGVALDLWRKAVSPEQTQAEVEFLQRELQVAPGARLLDVPCGLGRHSLALAAVGFRMTGVDQSAEALDEARLVGAVAGLAVDWRHADMRELPWEAEFDGCFCLGNSFGYLDVDGTRQFVQAVSRSLKPGARFVLDYGLSAESILPRLREREWAQIDDIYFLEENRYDVAESCIQTTYTFIRGGQADVRVGRQWVFTVREIRSILADAGLKVERLLRSTAGEAFDVASPLLLGVAQKK